MTWLQLSDRIAVVTGGASGIGRAAALALADAGATVVVADVNVTGAEAVAGGLRHADACRLDVTDETSWEAMRARVEARFGGADVVVNCAGVGSAGPIETLTVADWQRVIGVNLTGTFLGCRTAFALMQGRRSEAAIVNIASLAAVLGGEDIPAYNAAKGGVLALTRSVALRGAGRTPPIRCNVVLPGFVDTPMLDRLGDAIGSRAALLAELAKRTPLRRLVAPEDVADVVVFLASPRARMISGAAVPIDGGILAYGEPPTVVAAELAQHRAERAS